MTFWAKLKPLISQTRSTDPRRFDDPGADCAAEKSYEIPVVQPTSENCREKAQTRGQFLARQERWEDLSAEMRSADTDSTRTNCGRSFATLLSMGARADVVQASADALADGIEPSLEGIEDLSDLSLVYGDDYAIAEFVAQAHMDIARLWLGAQAPQSDSVQRVFDAHFACAAETLAPFTAQMQSSPLLARAQCSLVLGQPYAQQRFIPAYEHLARLAPEDTVALRSLGLLLLPSKLGSYAQLDSEAQRFAQLTADTWGNGGYAWVYIDALQRDPQAIDSLDLDLFLDGLDEILHLNPEQHIVNQLAAFTGVALAPERQAHDASNARAEKRRAIHAHFGHILREHLQELHPLLWAEVDLAPLPTTVLPARQALLRKGEDCARNAIASHLSSAREAAA